MKKRQRLMKHWKSIIARGKRASTIKDDNHRERVLRVIIAKEMRVLKSLHAIREHHEQR